MYAASEHLVGELKKCAPPGTRHIATLTTASKPSHLRSMFAFSIINQYSLPNKRHEAILHLTLETIFSHWVRTHLPLGNYAPAGRAVQRSGSIIAIPTLSGLHHHYVRI